MLSRIDNNGSVGYDSSSMAILIDSFMNGARGPFHFRHRRCGHLVSDTSIEELHAFAEKLGMRREWFQRRSIPHYDLTGERYNLALAMGAELVSSRELVRRAVRWSKTKTFLHCFRKEDLSWQRASSITATVLRRP